MKVFWDERYKQNKFAYGIEPNQFLKEKIAELKVDKILFPTEGEGKNAIFAAKKRMECFCI